MNAVGVGYPSKIDGMEIGASVSGQIDVRDAENLANEAARSGRRASSAFASVLPVMFLPNGRLLGALQSLINGVYKGPFASLQTFFAVSHDSVVAASASRTTGSTLSWPGAKDQPVYARLDAMLEKLVKESGGDYVKSPLAGSVMGHQPATAHPLGGCGMGRDRSSGVVDHRCRVFSGSAGAGDTAVHDGLTLSTASVIRVRSASIRCSPSRRSRNAP